VAQKKSYSRYFIILQEEETGYSLASDKLPSGYTKLETKNDKCKISFYVQNLKKEKEPYYMVLICNKKDTKKLIKLGVLNIDDYGRAETTYEFGAENIADSKISVDLVGGSAIVKMEDSKLIPVMSGFTSTEPPKDWRSFSIFEENLQELEEQLQEVKKNEEEAVQQVDTREVESSDKPKEEKNIFEEYEQKIEEIKSVNEDVNEKEGTTNKEDVREEEDVAQKDESTEETRDELTNADENIKEEDKEIKSSESTEGLDSLPDDARHHDKKECKNKENDNNKHECDDKKHECDNKKHECDNKKHKCDDNEKCKDNDYPTGTVGEFFKLIAEDFEELKGICTEIKKCKWYKVPVENLEGAGINSNYNKYTIVFYPMISYYNYIKKHGHYMLGYKYDSKGKMKYLVYGIPGTKKMCDQPYGGKSGFVTWVPVKEGDESDNSYGYWLMFYDFRTSTIVIPVK
jgi:hypothetical protein